MVVVGVLPCQHFFGEGLGHRQHLQGVAVVQAQDGGAALGLDADACEGELPSSGTAVQRLRVVVEQQQGVRFRVDHLRHKPQPFRGEVVAFVDQHGAVLAARNRARLHAVDDRLHQQLRVGVCTVLRRRHAQPVALELLAAPFVEVAHGNPVLHPVPLHQVFEAAGQGLVVAEHQHRLVLAAGKLHAAVAQDHRLAGSGHAMNDPVPVAKRAGELLLLQVHDPDDVGDLDRRVIGRSWRLQQVALHLDAQLREQVPAHTLDLRQAEQAGKRHQEHVPEPLLELLRVHALGHLVAADHASRRQEVLQLHLLELVAGDVGQHHAEAPRHQQLAGAFVARRVAQRRVLLQQADDLHRVVARLAQRVGFGHPAPFGIDDGAVAVDLRQGVRLPVLDLQHQEPAGRVQHHEVRMPVARPDGHVVPAQVLVIELVVQTRREAAFPAGHARQAGAAARNQRGHWIPPILGAPPAPYRSAPAASIRFCRPRHSDLHKAGDAGSERRDPSQRWSGPSRVAASGKMPSPTRTTRTSHGH